MISIEDYEKYYNSHYEPDTDTLFILNKDNRLTDDEMYKALNLDDELYDLDWASPTHEKKYSGIYDLNDFFGTVFDGEEVAVLATPEARLKYAFASMHDDNLIIELMQKHFPAILKIIPAKARSTTKPFLEYWMQKYDFTLEDFIFNNKYIVVSEGDFHKDTEAFCMLGLLNPDIKLCTNEDIIFKEEETKKC